MSGCALKLPKIKRLEMQALNIFVQRGCNFPITDGWRVAFCDVVVDRPEMSNFWCISARWAGAYFNLFLPEVFFSAWLQNWSDNDPLRIQRLPASILTGVVDGCCDQIISLLSQLNLGSCHINDVFKVVPEKEQSFSYWLKMFFWHKERQERLIGWIGVDQTGLAIVARLMQPRPMMQNNINIDELLIPIQFAIGMTILTYKKLRAVELGDVVLFDNLWLDANGALFVVIDKHFGFWVKWEGDQITVTSSICSVLAEKARKGVSMSEEQAEEDDEGDLWDDDDSEDDKPASSEGNFNLDAVNVSLIFEIGEKSLSIKELKQLQKGQVFDLGKPLDRAVSIRTNGLLIGQGELIDIDGHLGVKINSINAPKR